MVERSGIPAAAEAKEETLRLRAGDGCLLAAIHHPAVRDSPSHAAVLCPGGGIPARVYRHFAAWLAAVGIPVLCFDYRGIGGSRPDSLRGFEAGLEDWAEQDCAAAIGWLKQRYPDAQLLGIAHSIGGLILAGAPNAGAIGRFLFVGTHTGYWGDYHPRWRLPMTLAWHAAMPALARLCGYFPGRALGLGEDLPYAFALQWAGRLAPPIRTASARAAAGLACLQRLEGRALALSFTDDGFATARGTQRLLSLLPRLAAEHRVIAPREAALPRIGHFGFFRPAAARSLWPIAADWLLG